MYRPITLWPAATLALAILSITAMYGRPEISPADPAHADAIQGGRLPGFRHAGHRL